MSVLINNIRKYINELGNNELALRSNNESLQELWDQKQILLQEMNAAKKLAAEKAAEPYLETIAEIDQMYATILSLIAG